MIALLAAAVSVAQPNLNSILSEAEFALQAKRFEQARVLTATAVKAGGQGQRVDRLLADLAYADKRWAEAYRRYRSAWEHNSSDSRLLTRAGVAALKAGDVDAARPLLVQATTRADASWEAWNALGVLANQQLDWPQADAAFEKAVTLAPMRGEVLNNHGWSMLLRGEWNAALPLLERAAALAPGSSRIRNNLELARSALAEDLPRRAAGESGDAFAARLNDAGVAAMMRGEQSRAVAAFSQALTVSPIWYARAAQNLALSQGR